MIASGIDSVQMVDWMMTVSWETYTEMVEAIVLDAHLTPSERRKIAKMLGENEPCDTMPCEDQNLDREERVLRCLKAQSGHDSKQGGYD